MIWCSVDGLRNEKTFPLWIEQQNWIENEIFPAGDHLPPPPPLGCWKAPPARLKITLKSPKIREGAALWDSVQKNPKTGWETLAASFLFSCSSYQLHRLTGTWQQTSHWSFLCWFPPQCTWLTSIPGSTLTLWRFLSSCMWECEMWHHCWPAVPT